MEARVVVEDGAIVQEEGDRSDVPWWGVTKMAIAAATLTVVGEGRLDLDAPLAGRPDTLRQLLQHRAGLRESAKADQLIYAPGTNWNYSNIGFFFVRELLEQTTGAPLGPLLERRVLQPLGLLGVRIARVSWRPTTIRAWMYHGTLIGPLAQAALFLDRLLAGGLLPPPGPQPSSLDMES